MTQINTLINENTEYVINLRRYFHMHPENSGEEFQTAIKIEEELDKMEIPHHRFSTTGVIASLSGNPSSNRTILLRADTDALPMQDEKTCDYASQTPGIMHACGHDAHTASLLLAAKVLKLTKNDWNGNVKLAFQPAEEIGHGALELISANELTNVDAVFSLHVASSMDSGIIGVRSGPMMASCDSFDITVTGRSGHVSAPHLSVDALYTACSIVTQLQSIVSRKVDPIESAVVGVGVLRSGTSYNIVADNAFIQGTNRAFTHMTRKLLNESVIRIAENTAASNGAKVNIVFKDANAPLINDLKWTTRMVSACSREFGEESIRSDVPQSLGADDFAELLALRPGVYMRIGTRNATDPNTAVSHHHPHFDIDETTLIKAARLFILAVEENGNI